MRLRNNLLCNTIIRKIHSKNEISKILSYNGIINKIDGKINNIIDYDKSLMEYRINEHRKIQRDSIGNIMFGICFGTAILYLGTSLEDVTSIFQYCIPPIIASIPLNIFNNIVNKLAHYNYLPIDYNTEDPYMIQDINGIIFNNPITLASGIDINCDGPQSYIKLGFGAVEVGTITIEPTDNNNKEGRGFINILLELLKYNKDDDDNDDSIIKRDNNTFNIYYSNEDDVLKSWSLNNIGVYEIRKRLDLIDFTSDLIRIGRIGISIKVNNGRDARIGIDTLADKVNWISLDCRHIENDVNKILHIYQAALARRKDFDYRYNKEKEEYHKTEGKYNKEIILDNQHHQGQQQQQQQQEQQQQQRQEEQRQEELAARLFIKVSVNQNEDARYELANKIKDYEIEGIIINGAVNNGNITISGRDIRSNINECVGKWYKQLNGKIPIIASGGVIRGHDALDLIEHGASIIQVYSAFIFQGPQAARRLKDQLSDLLLKRGYYNIQEAVGAKYNKKKSKRMKLFEKRRIPFIT